MKRISKSELSEKFALIETYWSPHIVAQLNGQQVRIAKVKGEFTWHHHEHEDEMFFVIKGSLTIRLRDQDDVVLNRGELVVIPRGVEHQPFAEEETHLLLFEPASTVNTGNVRNEQTKDELKRL